MCKAIFLAGVFFYPGCGLTYLVMACGLPVFLTKRFDVQANPYALALDLFRKQGTAEVKVEART